MTLKQRYSAVVEWFSAAMPDAATELHYDTPFHLLLAVILSAQCSDKRVNMVTPALFEAFPDAATLAASDAETVYSYIRSVSYPNNKTRALLGAARMLAGEFGGEVPGDIDSLMRLPGVGRKTANVMLSVIWGADAMPVDTHVFRVSERIGLTTGSRNPLQTERALTRNFPPGLLGKAHHWLILHGRYVCKARRPDCMSCGLTAVCRYFAANTRNSEKA